MKSINTGNSWKPTKPLVREITDFALSCSALGDNYDTGIKHRVSGKGAEYAAIALIDDWINHIPEDYIDITFPDLTVLNKHKRSFEPDLFLIQEDGEKVGVHIKCFFHNPEWTENFQSWVFNVMDPCAKGKTRKDIFIFLNELNGRYKIMWVGNVYKDLYLKDMFQPTRKKCKVNNVAVYHATLINT